MQILTLARITALTAVFALASVFSAQAAPLHYLVHYKSNGTRAGARYFHIRYRTLDLQGKPTIASGLIALPKDQGQSKGLRWVSYQHGTTSFRDEVPSRTPANTPIGIAVRTLLANDYVVVAADGLNLGDQRTGIHPLLHSESEARVAADMLSAALEFFPLQGAPSPRELYLAGYSQGGHWTVALQRSLEAHPRPGIRIKASFPMEGPYDLSETMIDTILDRPGSYVSFLSAYVLLAMQSIYGDLYSSLHDVFLPEYVDQVPRLFDGTHSTVQIYRALPEEPAKLYRPEFLQALRACDHPFRVALRKNDVYDWTPKAPIVLIHSRGDREVPIENAEVFRAKLSEKGIDVPLIETPGEFNHPAGFIPALGILLHEMEAMNER